MNIKHIIDQMTLDQKIGATLTLGFAGTIPRRHTYDYITKFHCGGLRLSPIFKQFGNYVNPLTGETVVDLKGNDFLKDTPPAYLNASEYKAVLDDFKALARKRPLGLPLHFSFDQEGGTSADYNFGGVNLFTKPMGLRASNKPEMAYEVAKAVGQQSLAVGFNFLHSPVLDINVDSRNPEIYTRAYGDDAEIVSQYAIETCKGLKEVGMIATGKHFPGRGDSPVDAHYELPVIDVDEETLMARELLPYKRLIEMDLLPSIMIAHSIFPAIDPDHVATVSEKIVTGLLRNKLGFKGVITTDSMTMGALATRYGIANACAMALEAGCDLVLMKAENELVEETFNTIKSFVQSGRIPEADLDLKVERLLEMKKAYGLFDDQEGKESPEAVNERIKASDLPRQAALGSVLPFHSDKKMTLPISKEEKVLVVEQLNKNVPNDRHWYYGYLYKQCLDLGGQVDCYEIDYRISPADRDQVLEVAGHYDTIIITNFYVRSRTANNEMITLLNQKYPDRIITVNNTPYQLSAPQGLNHVITTLATTPENLRVVAEMIYEGIEPTGVWPLTLKKEWSYE